MRAWYGGAAVLLGLVLSTGCGEMAEGPALVTLRPQPAPEATEPEVVEEGLPAIAQAPSCVQISYATLGRILASRGVDLLNPGADSAGALYRNSRAVFGADLKAEERSGPSHPWSVAAMRLFDILLAAAPEIIVGMPTRMECELDGKWTSFFSVNGCTEEGIACLLGVPATQELVAECNALVSAVPNPELGKRLAVATLAAPFYLCE